MKRNLMNWFWLALACLLSACATTGQPAAQADTFAKKLLVGYATVEGLARSADELRAAGALSEADRANVAKMSLTAIEGMAVARQLAATDEAAATAKLQVSLTTLKALQAYLLSKGAKQ